MAKKVKSVSFNDNNNEEKEMLKYIGRRNFSKYIKGLIRNDKLLHDMQSEGIKKEIPFGGINNDKPKNKYKQYLINEKKPMQETHRLINQGEIKFNLFKDVQS